MRTRSQRPEARSQNGRAARVSKRRVSGARKGLPPLRLEYIEAGSLADNPANWRRHPEGQRTALKAVLDDVGWAGALLYNERTKRLIDGHARKNAVPPHTRVPVLVGRFTPEQERKVLATLDPLGAMAEADEKALADLLADTELGKLPGADELNAMLAELAGGEPASDVETDQQADEKRQAARARRISELYAVIVECRNEREQLAFYRRMQKEGRKCKLHVL